MKIVSRRAALRFALAALPLVPAGAGFCQAAPPAISASAQGTAVTFGGQLLMRIRTGAGGLTASQRADQVAQRMITVLSLHNLTAADIVVSQTRKYQDATILVRGHLLVTVDKGLAQANGNNDPGDLARQWADNLRNVLPTISVAPNPNLKH